MNKLRVDSNNLNLLFGILDRNLNQLEKSLNVKIEYNNNHLIVTGDKSDIATEVVIELLKLVENNINITFQIIDQVIELKFDGISYYEEIVSQPVFCYNSTNKPIKAKTINQAKYLNAIENYEIVFGIGPAGTGKTYLAIAAAIKSLRNNEISKIILSRPAIEAGEQLGFLPGDLDEKVDPYLRPLYDALYDILDKEKTMKLKEKGIIEIVPLAYMRGRTLDNAFIILDEAQNCTKEQLKMFLTRMGNNSRVVINGDTTQVDLPRNITSGLITIQDILSNIDEIKFSYFDDVDIVRNRLVKKIIKAYSKYS